MRLARSVVHEGRLFLSAGVTLQPSYLRRLQEMGYRSLYISDGGADDVEVPEIVTVETRQAVTATVQQSMQRLAVGEAVSPAVVQDAVQLLLNEILTSRDVLVAMVDVKSIMDHTFAHSTNVAVLSLLVGRLMGLSRAQLHELGIGAVLHDIGKARVPETIVTKPGKLDAAEMEEMKRHTIYGFEALRAIRTFSLLSAHVAFQHHERLDGSGYPRGLRSEEIHVYARICAVCDVFDALSSDRPYRKAAHPLEAISQLNEGAGEKFDSAVVREFTRVIAPYPVASLVRLSTGEMAVVKSIRTASPRRPLVRVFRDAQGNSVKDGREIDLSQEPGVEIAGHVSWGEDVRN